VALRAVLKVSVEYVALALVYCFPCGYVTLRAVRKSRVVASSCSVGKSCLGLEINNKCV
jgi:hypothetical protein